MGEVIASRDELHGIGVDVTEHSLESAFEAILIRGGWEEGTNEGYDRSLALKVDSLERFLRSTQPKAWGRLSRAYPGREMAEVERALAARLEPHGRQGGVVSALREGFRVGGTHFDLAYFEPASDRNEGAWGLYRSNVMEEVRQLRYGNLASDRDDSVDMALFVNGVPVVLLELKNNASGQRREDAERQWARDRNPRETLFSPDRRAVAYFAVDDLSASMVTWLRGGGTGRFFPYDRGTEDGGSGNPEPTEGERFRTDYLFRDVLSPSSLLEILRKYVRCDYWDKKGDGHGKDELRAVIFPRYHQRDCVRRLVADAREKGPGRNYLIQHSAGSGKSNTIAWLANQLSSLHGTDGAAVFDSVIVLTDRRQLDTQLSDVVFSVDHRGGVIFRVTERGGSKDLKRAIEARAKIITSTIEKFPYICDETLTSGRTFAVVIDEAHSSQSGDTHRKMRETLSDIEALDPAERRDILDRLSEREGAEVAELDPEDRVTRELAAQGTLPNISFFAFTATPKAATLDVFGTRGADGKPRPFHLYSMRQAIEEGFILDVLDHYVDYDCYYRLVKRAGEDPSLETRAGARALAAFAHGHPDSIAERAAIVAEHFSANVAGDLGGRAKAMVVTSSRAEAVLWFRALRRYCAEHGMTSLGIMVAFSGAVEEAPGREVTEASLNGEGSEAETVARFDRDDERVMVAANKFQTGFDQPKLEAMYVDKVLTGVAAVQTLSRVNRPMPGKRTFVLDFVNDADQIQASFRTYYKEAAIDRTTDPNVPYDIKDRLDGMRVYTDEEVARVAEVFYGSPDEESALPEISLVLSRVCDRFRGLDDDGRHTFKGLCGKFHKAYSRVTQMIPLHDPELAAYHVFVAHLLRFAGFRVGGEGRVDLGGRVDLESLRVTGGAERDISVDASQQMHNGGSSAGIAPQKEYERLSELIREFNEVFGSGVTEEVGARNLQAIGDLFCKDRDIREKAENNSEDEWEYPFSERFESIVLDLALDNERFGEVLGRDPEAKDWLKRHMRDYLYHRCRGEREDI